MQKRKGGENEEELKRDQNGNRFSKAELKKNKSKKKENFEQVA